MKRYNLDLPEDLHDKLVAEANSRHTTVAELMRQGVRLLLLAMDTRHELFVRDELGEQKLVVM